ncbi:MULTISPECIES: hypothetical protein [Halolamina]|uniref:Uncharacterized protein n=1 Tax=Halolamina pelagica TaxID=699431 RepID=A0A1I5QT52_9EURY|nr:MULTISPECIES: hypothetical protein [Halolamina]NHX35530.1 hypothetical protein [Halolamina sp. R1-12]SFP49435.1 hypothetical protein SAMN05216277_10474 [Halolamina pelagica]
MTGYYDYVLALIPAVLIGVTAALSLLGIPLRGALFLGAGASTVVVGHALFVRTPVADERRTPDAPARSEPPASNAD